MKNIIKYKEIVYCNDGDSIRNNSSNPQEKKAVDTSSTVDNKQSNNIPQEKKAVDTSSTGNAQQPNNKQNEKPNTVNFKQSKNMKNNNN